MTQSIETTDAEALDCAPERTAMNTEELKKLAEAATPGPWSAFIAKTTLAVDIGPVAHGTRPNIVDWMGFDGCELPKAQRRRNAKFIAAANPAKILELLAIIDNLTAQRDAAVSVCRAIVRYQSIIDQLAPPTGTSLLEAYAEAFEGAEEVVAQIDAAIAASEGGKAL